ncbi:hypothetical protein ACUWCL_29495, partial [Klebsiella pneumoniae]|uniref:hypothetical protein n=1 Tax=Klebsiella pneumoniae TaxID=573 RepID=UPI0040558A93
MSIEVILFYKNHLINNFPLFYSYLELKFSIFIAGIFMSINHQSIGNLFDAVQPFADKPLILNR